MQDTLNTISYVGGLIVGLLFIFGVILTIFLLLIALLVDRMQNQLDKELAEQDPFDAYQ